MIGSLGGPMAVFVPATLVSAVPVDTLPSDWLSIRNRWEAFHAARTFISLAGFESRWRRRYGHVRMPRH